MKKVVSYSLYGDIKKYTVGAIKNAEEISMYYPGWEGWFYVGKTVPEEIIAKLKSLGMKVIFMNEEENSASMLWRFFVFADENVEYAIIRDTDSRLSEREARAVKEWIESGKGFHSMRDNPCHKSLMMGGMWGAKAEKLRDIKNLINDWHGEKLYSADQDFLKEMVYPRAYPDSIIHASFNAYEPHAIPFPTKRDGYHFVGEIFDENDVPDSYGLARLKIANYWWPRKFFYLLFQKLFKKKKAIQRKSGMRIVNVSTSLFSVSGPSRLITAERLNGIDAVALVKSHGEVHFPCYKNTLTFGQKITYLYVKTIDKCYKLTYKILRILSHTKRPDYPWNDGVFGEPIHNSVNKLGADIVHLHWIASGFPAIKFLPEINKPIVWTFHDTWPITAGHHYPLNCDADCEACKKDGKNCKQFRKNYSRFPSSESLWNYKKNCYKKIKNLTIIAHSHWLGKMAEESPLLEGRKVFIIPSCVDTNLFRPLDKDAVKKQLHVPLDKKIILFSASGGIRAPYKGFDLLVDTLKILKNEMNIDNIHLLVIGSSDSGGMSLPFPTTFFGHIDSEQMLNIIYNAADVFVGPSRQDNFPNTFVEALSCGVPGVGFHVGGIPEIVLHKERGYIANRFDTRDLANGITWVLNDVERYKTLSQNSRRFVEENLSFRIISEKHRKLYEQILSETKNTQK